jgi:hypothetical protein
MEASALIKIFVGDSINKWIEPKLNFIFTKFDKKIKILTHDYFINKFRDYLERRYIKFFSIDTFVFQNSPKPLKSLYEPITIVRGNKNDKLFVSESETIVDKGFANVFGKKLKVEKYLIDGNKISFVNRYNKILICDDAGMGKSTFIKRIFLTIVESNSGIPVLVEL